MKLTLYLGSGSNSRKSLLSAAQIPFTLLSHNSDESVCPLNQSLSAMVTEIALLKMQHMQTPVGTEGEVALFLTADTLTKNWENKIYSKPVDKQDAINMLAGCRKGAIVGTAFCLEKREFSKGSWKLLDRRVGYNQAWCVVHIPDEFVEFYLKNIPFMDVSGGLAIEGFGEQFVKEIDGCYSAILGLPMYELRQALYELGFYQFDS